MRFTFPSLSTMMLTSILALSLLFPMAGALAAMKTDINSANIAQLEAVTGIGQDTAQKILDYKKEHGKFTSMDELEAVSGVGKVRLQALNEIFMVKPTKKTK